MSRDPQINIRLPQELKEKVHQIASENRRSVNAEIVKMIESSIDEYEFFKDSEGVGHYSFEDFPDEHEILDREWKAKVENAIDLLKKELLSVKID
ncbi:Arc family DNA-binding protein [Xenorhabdus ishibashii]|uniref:Rha family transcriptional regulator n=1 Tax=Xenorhabdus ishibashii TaxID=1034471 RepID=A0A2D0KCK1_9GAMM|nr:Arc family DNA-binding protein [Xenorhabdus ishibashii]PHM61176.1 Rha family transcriptional regulator [Xenorhabdus ishibashii]